MDFKVNSTDKGLKIEIDGTLTFDSHRDFKDVLNAIRNAQEDVEISLKGLSNMDSAGAGMLKLAQDKAQQNGKDFKLADVPEDLEVFVALLK
ncbi:MAG: lipid asymmetry maintenance protein MlaB [Kordiimonas sp.]